MIVTICGLCGKLIQYSSARRSGIADIGKSSTRSSCSVARAWSSPSSTAVLELHGGRGLYTPIISV